MDYAWFWLYLWTRLDAFHSVAEGMLAIGGTTTFLAVVLAVLAFAHDDQDFGTTMKRVAKRCGFFMLLPAVIFSMLVPTKSDLAVILGGHFAGQAIVSEEMNETASKIYQLIQRELDERLEEVVADE